MQFCSVALGSLVLFLFFKKISCFSYFSFYILQKSKFNPCVDHTIIRCLCFSNTNILYCYIQFLFDAIKMDYRNYDYENYSLLYMDKEDDYFNDYFFNYWSTKMKTNPAVFLENLKLKWFSEIAMVSFFDSVIINYVWSNMWRTIIGRKKNV